MEWLFDYDLWASFLSLTALEIVLGIDNLVFLALVADHLPAKKARKARFVGMIMALVMRLALLASALWIIGMVEPWFTIADVDFSGRDLLMLLGGLFLLWKATASIREEVTGEERKELRASKGGFLKTIIQIAFIDLIFSFDSIITAVGLTTNMGVISAAIIVSIVMMLLSSEFIARFISHNPTIKMLALAFIMMIGVFLMAEGLGLHVPKGYIYFGMAFSMGVEALNMWVRKKKKA
ncbi:MAG: TerC family protein [Alphaproteobacteria bacterium]|nr:TerC family protein [Alphaproteobacteria bacterium]